MAKRLIQSESGFTIIEVLVALTIFAVFATSMTLTQVANKDRSMRMASDLEVHNLAQMKMNEVLIQRHNFTNATESSPETGSIEIEGFEHYKYSIEFKKNEFPDFSGLIGQSEEEANQVDPNASIKKVIFEKMKKNVEEMMWQVKVTIINTQLDKDPGYELNSWINKANAKVDTNFGF